MIYTVLVLAIVLLVACLLIKKANTNMLYVFGRLYLIKRDNARRYEPAVSIGFMRGISPPWYTGRGLQLRIKQQSLQIGICKPGIAKTDEEGVLEAVGGRYLDKPVDELRNW